MPRRHVPPAVLAAAAALALVPACTTHPNQPAQTSTSTATTTSAPAQPHGVYEQCLVQHGVPTPPAGPPPGPTQQPAGPLPGPAQGGPGATPAPPPPGVDQNTWGNAQKACASLQQTPTTPGS
jgi:hypothetical protein